MTEPAALSHDRHGPLTRHRLALLATFLLTITIAWLSLTPAPPIPNLDSPLSNKLYHVIAYAALVFPTALLCARSLLWVLPLALLFGGAIEFAQRYTGREAEMADVLANAAGLGTGSAMGLVLRAWLRRSA